jgi:hypothetical protein
LPGEISRVLGQPNPGFSSASSSAASESAENLDDLLGELDKVARG